MTKTERVASLSAEKSKPAVQKVQTEREIQAQIEALSLSLASLSEQNLVTSRGLLNRMTKSAGDAERSIKESTRKASLSARALNQAAKRLESINSRNRCWTLIAASVSGLILGAVLLTLLLLWQPHLIELLWKMSQSL